MKTNDREILIFYHPEIPLHRRTVAHAKSLSNHIKDVPFNKDAVTNMDWKALLDMLGMAPKDLLDKSTDYYQKNIRGRDFDKEGWLNVLRYNPDIILAPIAVRGKEAVQCLSPPDVYKLMKKHPTLIIDMEPGNSQ